MGWGGWAAEGQVGVGENERDSVAEDLLGAAWVCFYFFALFGVALQAVGVTGRRVRVSPLAELGFVSDFRLMSVSRR